MSEKRQRNAVERRDRAEERAQRARERADREREGGELVLARRHDGAAERQEAAALAAERLRWADVTIEGDQLGDDQRSAS